MIDNSRQSTPGGNRSVGRERTAVNREPIDFDPYAPSHEPDHRRQAELRQKCPMAPTPSGWFVSRYDDVVSVLKDPETFFSSTIITDGLDADQLPLPNVREPEHARLRRIVNGAIAAHRTKGMGPFIQELSERLLDEAIATSDENGVVDMVDAYAGPLPMQMIAHLLGVEEKDTKTFRIWAGEFIERLFELPPTPYSQIHPELSAGVRELIEERRHGNDDASDFISKLLKADFSDEAVLTQSLHLLIAGMDTTKALLGNVLERLALDPELFATVSRDRNLIPSLVEESLRLDPPIQVMGRDVEEDVLLGGEEVCAGQHMIVGLASANRDGTVFDDSDSFRIGRKDAHSHISFGTGPHVCPGAFLARLEGVVALQVLFAKVSSMSVIEDYVFDGEPAYWTRAPRVLPVALHR